MLRLKKIQIFYLFLTQFEDALNAFKLLCLHPAKIRTLSAFPDYLFAFAHIALFASGKLLELLCLGSEHRLRRMVSSIFVQDLNRLTVSDTASYIRG